MRKLIVLSMLGVLITGCSQGPADPWTEQRETVVPASGFVMLDGEPLAGATVVLQSQGKQIGAPGISDENGVVILKTYEDGDGAVPGEHKVIVTKYSNVSLPEGVNEDEVDEVPEPELMTPALYASFESTPLTMMVLESGENELLFDLQTQ